MNKALAIVVFASLVLTDCQKPIRISAVPDIKFTSFQAFDTTDILGNKARGGRLKFYFEDGDGDLGLDPPTIPGQDSVNLFFKLYRMVKGTLEQAADNDPLTPSNYRIPYLTQVGQNRALSGTVSVTFLYLFYQPADTIQYQFFVRDRASHVSNVVTTCIIPLTKDTTCTGN